LNRTRITEDEKILLLLISAGGYVTAVESVFLKKKKNKRSVSQRILRKVLRIFAPFNI